MIRQRPSLLATSLFASALALLGGCASTTDTTADNDRAREEFERRTGGDADAAGDDTSMATADAGSAAESDPLTDTEEDMNPGTGSATGAGQGVIAGGGAQAGTPTAPAAGDLDAEILGVVQSTNNAELKASELALTKATSPEVKAYAQKMIQHHEQAYGQVQGLGLAPVMGQISQELDTKTTALMGVLEGQTGADFDRAYMDSQILLHQQALALIDQQLLPGATRPEVRTLLESVRAAVAGHLQEAQQLRATLGAATGATPQQ